MSAGRWGAFIGVAISFTLAGGGTAQALTYEVDTPVDVASGNCTATPADCPLRRAVQLANGTTADDVIVLTTNVQLNIAGADDNANATDDIDIEADTASGSLILRSDAGMRKIDKSGAAGNIRILDIAVSDTENVTIEDVEVTGGNYTTNPLIGGGGIHFTGFATTSTLRLDNIHLHGNATGSGVALARGGGLAASGTGQVEIVGGSVIEDNVAGAAVAGAKGYGGGVSVVDGVDLAITDSVVRGNTAGTGTGANEARGGGVYVSNNQAVTTTVSVTGTEVDDNHAGGFGSTGNVNFGGGLYAEGTNGGSVLNVSLASGSFTGNSVAGGSGNAQGTGGGLAIVRQGGAAATLSVTDYDVIGNRAGGADWMETNPTTDNVAGGFGAGISTQVTTTISGSTFEGNRAGVVEGNPARSTTGLGGAVRSESGLPATGLTVTGSSFEDNIAGNGGGGGGSNGGAITAHNDGVLSVTGSQIVGNRSEGGGGGIHRFVTGSGAADSITSTELSGNFSDAPGGGIHLETARELSINRSLVSGNQATGAQGTGGGINATSTSPAPSPLGTLTMLNSTVTGNTSGDPSVAGSFQSLGGGIALGQLEEINLEVRHSTIASNTVDTGTNLPFVGYGGGGNIGYAPVSPAPSVSIANSIVSDGTASGPNSSAPNCLQGTPFTSAGGNLEGPDSGGASTNSCGFTNTAQGDQTGINPLLAPLTDNGGPTRTRALLPGSPALNRIDPDDCGTAVDQRGETRPFAGGQCDVGAYELGDRDGDGLLDTSDNCPTQAGPASNVGCPLAVADPPKDQPAAKCPKGKVKKKVKGKVKCVKKKKKKKRR